MATMPEVPSNAMNDGENPTNAILQYCNIQFNIGTRVRTRVAATAVLSILQYPSKQIHNCHSVDDKVR